MKSLNKEESQTLDEKLIARAERIEDRPDGRYVIFSADALSSEEFTELIMREVRRRQHARNVE